MCLLVDILFHSCRDTGSERERFTHIEKKSDRDREKYR